MKIQRRDGMLSFQPYFDIRHKTEGRAVSYTHRPHFTAKEIPWYLLVYEAKLTPGLMNKERRKKSPENFQRPYWESNPEPPSSGAVPQPTAAPLASVIKRRDEISISFLFLYQYFYKICNIIKPEENYPPLALVTTRTHTHRGILFSHYL
jgi:hypothetical protein